MSGFNEFQGKVIAFLQEEDVVSRGRLEQSWEFAAMFPIVDAVGLISKG
jgi:hypothetical protein